MKVIILCRNIATCSFKSVKICKALIAEVAEKSRWPRIWVGALEHGGRYTAGLQVLTRLMSHHGRGSLAPSVKILTLM